jgi:16S rRNA (guanine966-N2)-methyltransferase
MRVVGGVWRGRRLVAPRGVATRPTSDVVREAIFNVLAAALASRPAADRHEQSAAVEPPERAPVAGPLEGMAVLDLFAGSGALGIEALSRGAASCTFVERAPAAARALRDNLTRVGARDGTVLVRVGDYRRALKADAAGARLYNLVLVDAPYASYPTVEPELSNRLPAVLAPGAVVVVETARGQVVNLPLVETSVKLYGDTRVTFCSEV